MNFLQDLVNELSNESKDNSKELDELYDYVVESSGNELHQVIDFMTTIQSNFESHFSNGDVSFENYQSYSRKLSLILSTSGVDLPSAILVPSFESLSFSDYSTEAEEKKDGLLKRAWDGLVKMIKRFWAWLTGKSAKDKDRVKTLEAKEYKLKSNIKYTLEIVKTKRDQPLMSINASSTLKDLPKVGSSTNDTSPKSKVSTSPPPASKAPPAASKVTRPLDSEMVIKVNTYKSLVRGNVLDPKAYVTSSDNTLKLIYKAYDVFSKGNLKEVNDYVELLSKHIVDPIVDQEMLRLEIDWDESLNLLYHSKGYGVANLSKLLDKKLTAFESSVKELESNVGKDDSDKLNKEQLELTKRKLVLFKLTDDKIKDYMVSIDFALSEYTKMHALIEKSYKLWDKLLASNPNLTVAELNKAIAESR